MPTTRMITILAPNACRLLVLVEPGRSCASWASTPTLRNAGRNPPGQRFCKQPRISRTDGETLCSKTPMATFGPLASQLFERRLDSNRCLALTIAARTYILVGFAPHHI